DSSRWQNSKRHAESKGRQDWQHRRAAFDKLERLTIDTVEHADDVLPIVHIDDVQIPAPPPAEPVGVGRQTYIEPVVVWEPSAVDVGYTTPIHIEDDTAPIGVNFCFYLAGLWIAYLDDAWLDADWIGPREAASVGE